MNLLIEAKPKGDSKKKELKLFPIRRKKKNSDMRISELKRVDKKELTLLSPSIISQIKGE